jgi:hypothetical protein
MSEQAQSISTMIMTGESRSTGGKETCPNATLSTTNPHMAWSGIEHRHVTGLTAGSIPRGEISSGSVNEGNICPFFFVS